MLLRRLIKEKAKLNMSSWEKAYQNDNELFSQVNNSLLDFAGGMSTRDKHVIMWNLEDDDPRDVRNFVPAYLVKISMLGYEITDDKDDICFASINFDGDGGIIDLWGTMIKFPTEEFVEFCRNNVYFTTVVTSVLMVLTTKLPPSVKNSIVRLQK